jgi:hypothetical protein
MEKQIHQPQIWKIFEKLNKKIRSHQQQFAEIARILVRLTNFFSHIPYLSRKIGNEVQLLAAKRYQ